MGRKNKTGRDWSDVSVRREQRREYCRKNPASMLSNSARGRSKKLGLECDIDREYVESIWPKDGRCPYFGVPLTDCYKAGGGPAGPMFPFNPSIDRIDPARGYVKGNVMIVSCLANRMKQNATAEQLIAFAESVIRLHKNGLI